MYVAVWLLRRADTEERVQAKNVPKGVLELLGAIRADVERLSELSKEHRDIFADPSWRDPVQGLHEYVLWLSLIYGLLTGYFGSDLQEVLRECERKYLKKRGLLKKVNKLLSDGDMDRHLTRIHQKLQKAYSKWMVRVVT